MQVSWQSLDALKPSKIAIAIERMSFSSRLASFTLGHVREVLRRKNIHKEVSSFAFKVKVTHSDVPPNCRKSLKTTESMRTDISNLVLKLKQ